MVARPLQTISDRNLTAMAFANRVEMTSQEYRMRLQRKAATMRAAVLDGETADGRVLAVAEALERLAGNGS